VNAEEEKRRREHEKIRELQRIVRAGGKGYTHVRGGGLRVPKQAVFVREDVEDESIIQVDVDVGMDVDVGQGYGAGEHAAPTPATATVPSAVVGGGIKEEPMDVDVGEGVSPPPPPPPPPSKSRSRAKGPPPPPAPRTSSRRSARSAAPPPPSIAAAPIASASTSASASRPSKRVKVKHEYEFEEEEGEEGEGEEEGVVVMHDPYGGASTKGKAASSTPPSPYNGYGGKSVEAVSMGRAGSMPSVGGKSLEALGLGGKPPPTSASAKRSTGISRTKSKDSGGSRGAKEPKPKKEKEKGTRERKEKTRPETYKQAWSVEEQRLLEQLLEEIPEGEGFRCVAVRFSSYIPPFFFFVTPLLLFPLPLPFHAAFTLANPNAYKHAGGKKSPARWEDGGRRGRWRVGCKSISRS
jgi:hypothetical protein